MKKVIVPLMSVAFYFLIYVAIILLKPVHHDQIRSVYLSTHATVQQIADSIRLHGLAFQLGQTKQTAAYYPGQIQGEHYQHQRSDTADDDLSPAQWKVFQSWKLIVKNNTDYWLGNESVSKKPLSNKFPCLLCNVTPESKLFTLQKSINDKLGFVSKDKSRQEALYRIFDGLLTHFTLLSSNLSANCTEIHNYLPQIYKKEQRGNNLMFLYQSTAKTVKKVLEANNISLFPHSFEDEFTATNNLKNLKTQMQNVTLDNYKSYWKSLYNKSQILKEFKNISTIFKCNQSIECSAITKAYIKALGLVLRSEYQQTNTITIQQFIEIFTFFQAITYSLEIYYDRKSETVKLQHMKSWLDFTDVYYFILGLGCVVVYMFSQIDIEKKVKRQFRHAFPPGNKFKLDD